MKHLGKLCVFLWLATGSFSAAATRDENNPTLTSPTSTMETIVERASDLRPEGFRQIGDRSATTWLTPGGSGEQAIAFNPAYGLASIKLLTGNDTADVETNAAILEMSTLNASDRSGPFVPWPFLLISAGCALLLWASQKQKSA